jgi:hypothetical protein
MTSSASARTWSKMKMGGAVVVGCTAMLACSGPAAEDGATSPFPTAEPQVRPLGTARDPNGPRVPVYPPEIFIPPPTIDPTKIPHMSGPGTLYISDSSSAGIIVWDVASMSPVAGFDYGPGSSRVAASHDLKSVYVTSAKPGTVTKIDTLTRSKLASMTLASGAGAVIVSGNGASVFVSDSSGHLYSTPATLNGPVVTETLPGNPIVDAMAWNADGKRLLIADGVSTKVFVRQSAAPGVFATLPLPAGPGTNGIGSLASMPSMGLVFAANFGADMVTAFDGNGALYPSAGSTVAVGDLPTFAAAHPSRPYVYVTRPRDNLLSILKVVMVNGQPQLSVAATIPDICERPRGVAFSHSQAMAFVVCDGAIVVLDSSTDTVFFSRPAPPRLSEVVWAY